MNIILLLKTVARHPITFWAATCLVFGVDLIVLIQIAQGHPFGRLFAVAIITTLFLGFWAANSLHHRSKK